MNRRESNERIKISGLNYTEYTHKRGRNTNNCSQRQVFVPNNNFGPYNRWYVQGPVGVAVSIPGQGQLGLHSGSLPQAGMFPLHGLLSNPGGQQVKSPISL